MKKYEIDYRKMYMSSEDFIEMFKFSLQKLLSLIFEKKDHVIKGKNFSYRTHDWSLFPLSGDNKKDLNWTSLEVIFTKNYYYGWYSGLTSSFSWCIGRYSYGYDKIDMWIDMWSKNMKKRVIKYLYKLQINEYSDNSLLIFWNRLRTIFDISVKSWRHKDQVEIYKVKTYLEPDEYRNSLINKILKS